jgi:hypothetical protein
MKKNVLKSKTFWFGILTAFSPLIPSVGKFLSENTAQIGMVWGAVSIVLRMVTKDKIVLID